MSVDFLIQSWFLHVNSLEGAGLLKTKTGSRKLGPSKSNEDPLDLRDVK